MSDPILIRYEKGIFLPELDLWLDPRVARKRAFVSHAHSDHYGAHHWTLCCESTQRLIACRYGLRASSHYIALSWGEVWEDRGFQLRLLPAGHILGSAMLHVKRMRDGATLLYTGDFKLREGFSSEKAELLPADTLMMETTFGKPSYRFPEKTQISEGIIAFMREALAAGETPVLLGYSLGKAQELLAVIGQTGLPVMVHPSVEQMTQVYEEVRGTLADWQVFQWEGAAGKVLLFPPSADRSLVPRKLVRLRTAMASGWALDASARYRYRVDALFPLSDHADYDELWQCVKQVKPVRIYTVHGFASEFAWDLRAQGYEAWSLVSENQLEFRL